MGKLYLIEKLSSKSGLFGMKDNLVYLNKSKINITYREQTKYIDLVFSVEIETVENDPSFEVGFYDMLLFKGDLNSDLSEQFSDLCRMYTLQDNTSLKEFFLGLVEMFSIDRKLKVKNAIGLFGELAFIYHNLKKNNLDLTKYWQYNGPTSRFDFSFPYSRLEVKTTSKQEEILVIKQNQVINSKNAFIAIVKIVDVIDGDTIKDIYERILCLLDNLSLLEFKLNVAKVWDFNDVEANKIRFTVLGLRCVSVSDMKMIKRYPKEITNLTYNYNFIDHQSVSLLEILVLV